MQSMTLSSDRALMRADWRRFWPLFFGYAAVWLCALPLGLWSQRSWAYYDTDRYSALENVSDYLHDCTAATCPAARCSGCCWPWPCSPI